MFSRMNKDQRINTVAASLELPAGDIKKYVLDNINYYWGGDEYSKGAYALYGKGQWFSVMPVIKEKREIFSLRVNILLTGRDSWKEQLIQVKKLLRAS